MSKKRLAFRDAIFYVCYLLLVWSFYRVYFSLPLGIEELLVKPIAWLLPVFYLVKKTKEKPASLGITTKNLFPSVYFALALGAVFAIEAIAINFVKYGGINFSANLGQEAVLFSLGVSLVTAVSEEVAFRGFVFNRVWQFLKNERFANLLTSLLWGVVHLPVAMLVLGLGGSALTTYLLLVVLFGIGSAFVFARTGNIISPILLHVLWQWPIILFR